MSTREVRSFDYVNHPYERVRDALRADALGVFSSATKAATSRARSLASELYVAVGGIRVAAEIRISVGRVEETSAGPRATPITRMELDWEAAQHRELFPLMDGELSIYPLTSTETQLDFSGRYQPPLGAVGGAIDAALGHRIAEASVHRFLADVARHLRETLREG